MCNKGKGMARFEHQFLYANIILRMPEHPHLTAVLRMLYFDQNTYVTGVYYYISRIYIFLIYSTVTQHPLPSSY